MSEVKSAEIVKVEKPGPLSTVKTTDELPIEAAVKALMNSGLIKDSDSVGKIITKVSFGRGIGLSDIAAINGISFSPNGTLILSAALMLALIKRSGKYRMEYLKRDEKACEIQMFERVDSVWYSCGVPCKFTWEDAVRAGLSNKATYKQYPTQMLTARCIADCFRTHCSDTTGVAVYTPEEIPDSGYKTDPESGDLVPDAEFEVKPKTRVTPTKVTEQPTPGASELTALAKATNSDLDQLASQYGVKSADQLNPEQIGQLVRVLKMKQKAPTK